MRFLDYWAELRQLMFPPAFRIHAIPERRIEPITDAVGQTAVDEGTERAEPTAEVLRQAVEHEKPETGDAVPDRVLAGVATCLWYIKTIFFKREWPSVDSDDNEPRVRKALNQVNKGMDILLGAGIEVQDPINRRCPPGSENLMKPLGHQPTAGLHYEKVTQTVAPIVFRRDRLIQRAEVFVAVPLVESKPKPQAAGSGPDDRAGS